jgi:ABC-type multidrug transport system fused ATPase/permease subunit
MALLGNVCFIGTVGFGGYMLLQQIMTIGELTSFLFYLIYIVNALSSLSELYYEVIRALGATDRLFKLMKSKPVINVNATGLTPKQPEGTIEFQDVIISLITYILGNILLSIKTKQFGIEWIQSQSRIW